MTKDHDPMTKSRRPLIVGNWKMNGLRTNSLTLASGIIHQLNNKKKTNCDIIICPPFPLLIPVASLLKGSPIKLGAQDCHHENSGAFTGDVSAELLQNVGCTFVIVGHSERRINHHEDDSRIRVKAETAIKAKLCAIICIGETLKQRTAGHTMKVIKKQLSKSIPQTSTAQNTVIAYEPVWAIGSGKVASSSQAQEVHAFIRKQLCKILGETSSQKIRILYGGSINFENAARLLSLPDVDGGLIGGASLNASKFCAITKNF